MLVGLQLLDEEVEEEPACFVTVKQSDEKLLLALARAAMRPVAVLKAQDLANTTWAFATVKLSDEQLFVALAKAAMRL